ncbi:unnamed protein product [Cyprideis torosa]|uniref:Uncharacterized protein n=1 Tax=Cyprideis torosa TaxID=163714 RepID=A0A7R8WR26_9CRUS|nr:unnamed protein product [Cyprideis torosa]CAG0903169.1 unnamed protein product [Cyprideis torosa]
MDSDRTPTNVRGVIEPPLLSSIKASGEPQQASTGTKRTRTPRGEPSTPKGTGLASGLVNTPGTYIVKKGTGKRGRNGTPAPVGTPSRQEPVAKKLKAGPENKHVFEPEEQKGWTPSKARKPQVVLTRAQMAPTNIASGFSFLPMGNVTTGLSTSKSSPALTRKILQDKENKAMKRKEALVEARKREVQKKNAERQKRAERLRKEHEEIQKRKAEEQIRLQKEEEQKRKQEAELKRKQEEAKKAAEEKEAEKRKLEGERGFEKEDLKKKMEERKKVKEVRKAAEERRRNKEAAAKEELAKQKKAVLSKIPCYIPENNSVDVKNMKCPKNSDDEFRVDKRLHPPWCQNKDWLKHQKHEIHPKYGDLLFKLQDPQQIVKEVDLIEIFGYKERFAHPRTSGWTEPPRVGLDYSFTGDTFLPHPPYMNRSKNATVNSTWNNTTQGNRTYTAKNLDFN